MSLDVEMIRTSFEAARPMSKDVVSKFYDILFSDHPEVQSTAKAFKWEEQRGSLIHSVIYIIDHLNSVEDLAKYIEGLGYHHRQCGFKEEYYDWCGESLLKTFSFFFREKWTEDLKNQWALFYSTLSSHALIGFKESEVKINFNAEITSQSVQMNSNLEVNPMTETNAANELETTNETPNESTESVEATAVAEVDLAAEIAETLEDMDAANEDTKAIDHGASETSAESQVEESTETLSTTPETENSEVEVSEPMPEVEAKIVEESSEPEAEVIELKSASEDTASVESASTHTAEEGDTPMPIAEEENVSELPTESETEVSLAEETPVAAEMTDKTQEGGPSLEELARQLAKQILTRALNEEIDKEFQNIAREKSAEILRFALEEEAKSLLKTFQEKVA